MAEAGHPRGVAAISLRTGKNTREMLPVRDAALNTISSRESLFGTSRTLSDNPKSQDVGSLPESVI
jgi:hypothetical protein